MLLLSKDLKLRGRVVDGESKIKVNIANKLSGNLEDERL